ncbi:GDP-L-fucose synthase family protein [Aestuariispira insulae]|uniref:GDP-L-fucose synthase n=1 Tax=Aestuariispira insulae TaxID=1461337 RepID=A0A3D9H2R0_9PROT|nr:GDP-L-fucose synthase [Aestuariispira insulae]RED43762.1 GDP-L-fucose synthase [Aestuariispira insulae]
MSLAKDAAIFLAGHRGLVGSAILRLLEARGYQNIITRSRDQLDLANQASVRDFFELERPAYVILAAARVGGIEANRTRPAEFISENLAIQGNVIDQAYRSGVKKLLFLGSSCIYPRLAAQPIREEALLSGPLEPTNEAYALAKIAGLKMCAAYRQQYGFDAISLMPTNLYGPGDNFDLESSHVIPALMRKAHEAKKSGAASLTVWGSGRPRREFLHVDDLASACLFAMDHYDEGSPMNVGTGQDLSIKQLAEAICHVVGFNGNLTWDDSMPDGTPRKLLDISRMSGLGWQASISLEEGLKSTYQWYLDNQT